MSYIKWNVTEYKKQEFLTFQWVIMWPDLNTFSTNDIWSSIGSFFVCFFACSILFYQILQFWMDRFSCFLKKKKGRDIPSAPWTHGRADTPCGILGWRRQRLPLCFWAYERCSGPPCTQRWWKMLCSWHTHALYQGSSLGTPLYTHTHTWIELVLKLCFRYL